MNRKILFLFGSAAFSILFILISLKIVYVMGEKYFFDKLFYRKSIAHGYLSSCGDPCDWSRFGDRAKDYLELQKWIGQSESTRNKDVMGTISNADFTVALIGDSFVWGQGIRNEERMAKLLQLSFDSLRRSHVYSFATPGDNIVGNYAKIIQLKEIINPNVWVYVFVGNDILPEWFDRYGAFYRKILGSKCRLEMVNDAVEKDEIKYHERTSSGWQTKGNLCMMREFVLELPSNTIILLTSSYPNDKNTMVFLSLLRELRADIVAVSLADGTKDEQYKKYWNNQKGNFYVSQKESHPSAISNKIYAEMIFREIISNPRWRFN